MSQFELSRPVKTRSLPAAPVYVEAGEEERSALADRFGLSAINTLNAEISLKQESRAIRATGPLRAEIVQQCAISGEDFPVSITEELDLRFVEEQEIDRETSEDDPIEIDLDLNDSDEIEYSGDTIDLGEAVAQSLGLAIDPYAEGPNADEARKKAGIVAEGEQAGPLAEALAALRKN